MNASNPRRVSPSASQRGGPDVHRRGITLLEVLISMGVLAVGLLGLASLLPVARFFMQDGSKYDHTATLGQQAIKELEIRSDLMNPVKWHGPSGAGMFNQVCPDSVTISGVTYDGAYNYLWTTQSAIPDYPAAPFVLDPLGCSYVSNLRANSNIYPDGTAGPASYANSAGPAFFPPAGYSLDFVGGTFAAPALNRLTIPREGGVLSNFAKPMSFAQAQKIFQSSDDLVFELPSDPTSRPYVAQPPNPMIRYATSQGDYSWFAVVDNMERPWNPGPDGGWGNATIDDNGDGVIDDISEAGWNPSDDKALWKASGAEKWHVWVVIVHKRNLQLQSYPSPSVVPPERMCYCDFLNAPSPAPANPQITANAGLGGDCALYVPTSLAPSDEWLNVKPNQWIMISAFPNEQSNPALTPVKAQLCRVAWFRISTVGEIVNTGKTYYRNVTLTGPDWNPYKFIDAIGAPGGFQSCYATIVDGVTGVYEATIEQVQN